MLGKISNHAFVGALLGIGVVVVLGSAALLFASKGQSTASVMGTADQSNAEVTGRAALTVEEIDPGDKVEVSVAELLQPGFIVVHQDQNRELGEVLGTSSLYSAGVYKDVQVGVSHPLTDSQVIHVVLYSDDGDGVFTSSDSPVSDENGLNIEVLKNVGMLPMDHAY